MNVDYPKGTHKPLGQPQSAPDVLLRPDAPALILPESKGISGLIPLEAVEAAHFIKLCTGAGLILPDIMYVAHVPNGGKRSKAEASRMNGEGVRAGYPDYLLDVSRGGYYGWRGELKRVKHEYPRDNQYDWLKRLRGCGYWANWHRGAEAMFADLIHYLQMAEAGTSQPELERKPVRSGRKTG